MDDLIIILAAIVVWGLLPAGLHLMVMLQMAKNTQHRRSLAKQRLREWRNQVPHVALQWPKEAHMGTRCTEHSTLWYIERAHPDALRQEVTTVAQRAIDSPTHLPN